MFKRLILENGHTTLAIIAFFLTATVFAFAIWRALKLRPEEKDHLASLPLKDDTASTQTVKSHRHGKRSEKN